MKLVLLCYLQVTPGYLVVTSCYPVYMTGACSVPYQTSKLELSVKSGEFPTGTTHQF